mmetsp:Transcript_5134/g.8892  ORF Transcript_5134/g.8892 Transcript_5134/m.8892 type:complete len:147 (+) Transcript_5134:370-810(+)
MTCLDMRCDVLMCHKMTMNCSLTRKILLSMLTCRAFSPLCLNLCVLLHIHVDRSNSFCRTDRRQTISARDVFDGLRCIQFEEFIEPLEKSLQEMREEAVAKKKAKKTEDTTGTDKTPSSSTNQAPQASPQGDDNLASTQRATADKT